MKSFERARCFTLGMLVMLMMSAMVTPTLAASATQQLQAVYNNIKLMYEGKEIVVKNADEKVLEPFLVDGELYIPAQALSAATEKAYEWDKNANTAYVGAKPGANLKTYWMLQVVPAYQSQSSYSGFINRAGKYTEYKSNSNKGNGDGTFKIAGVEYNNGAVWTSTNNSSRYYSDQVYALYNLEGKYKTMRAVAGPVEGTTNTNGKMVIYGDEKIIREITLTPDMIAANITIDVTGVKQLKIMVESYNSAMYGLGRMIIG